MVRVGQKSTHMRRLRFFKRSFKQVAEEVPTNPNKTKFTVIFPVSASSINDRNAVSFVTKLPKSETQFRGKIDTPVNFKESYLLLGVTCSQYAKMGTWARYSRTMEW